ncbi:serine/threonine-protein phosphatase 4 regulatory subunit 2 [Diabrotica virgifera virgifera]|uniref:Serine/threonine-protein phosphatase 4 regulatory subunit 2 n=1 Tax=Diabrotica virgifera virgifera TaxID=50390 RepID=A0ABM5K735_DIAVI|nr:serine/threonine-protein phosphatase 4 regulatory subunit 2 [Diabrotica virgifera virgifera]
MENPEEILHSLEEFSKMKPKDIPRELEEYLCFVAKTGNPIYQWPIIKSLFREKLINVITDFYESCPSVDIPPCPNVEMFNYDMMKNFILEKLDTFASAPFTVQRICELLTTPRKEYSRIDKYMRALEKNILVVSTVEPGRRSAENGEEGIMNGIESEHLPESSNSSHDINIEDMDESPSNWNRHDQDVPVSYKNGESEDLSKSEMEPATEEPATSFETEETKTEVPSSSTAEEPKAQTPETVITCTSTEETIETFVSIEPQEGTYQNLSEDSNTDSNSSDSSSSASVPEVKETVPIEEKQPAEEALEVDTTAVDTTDVPNQTETEVQKPESITEAEIEPTEPLIEETQFEITQVESTRELPTETPIEDISTEEVTPGPSEPEVLESLPEISEPTVAVETEDKEAEVVVEKSLDAPEDTLPVAPEVDVPVPEELENIVDSSTDDKKEEEDISEKLPQEEISESEKIETTNDADTATNELPDTKELSEESPMEVDVSQDKKSETEEPSSSVEPFLA